MVFKIAKADRMGYDHPDSFYPILRQRWRAADDPNDKYAMRVSIDNMDDLLRLIRDIGQWVIVHTDGGVPMLLIYDTYIE